MLAWVWRLDNGEEREKESERKECEERFACPRSLPPPFRFVFLLTIICTVPTIRAPGTGKF